MRPSITFTTTGNRQTCRQTGISSHSQSPTLLSVFQCCQTGQDGDILSLGTLFSTGHILPGPHAGCLAGHDDCCVHWADLRSTARCHLICTHCPGTQVSCVVCTQQSPSQNDITKRVRPAAQVGGIPAAHACDDAWHTTITWRLTDKLQRECRRS